jgi:hypothetical protein
MKYGLIGERLGHSFSKEIHEMLGYYTYELHEIAKSDIDSFMKNHDFLGINVTIPYKETVIPYLDNISPQALSIGAVNTIINKNGVLTGYNTDYYGMKALFERIKVNPKNKKAIICKDGKLSTLDYNVICYDNNQTYGFFKYDGVLTEFKYDYVASRATTILNDVIEYLKQKEYITSDEVKRSR